MSSHVVHSGATPFAADFGDVRAEFTALTSAAGIFALSSRVKIAVTGGDRVRWLNGMLTNNVRDLPVAWGIYAFLLNPQGHILGDLYAYNRGESLILDTDQAQLEKILAHFDHYIIMDDVELKNLSEELNTIGIAGPGAAEKLHQIGLEARDLQPLQCANQEWRDSPVTLVRTDNPAVPGYELWCAPDHSQALSEALINAGAIPAGTSALELLRIAAGIPRYGQDIRERDLPQETEQDRALHFAKGCYIGQEIVERIRSRGAVHRKFTGFEVVGSLPTMGTKIQLDNRDVGEITSAASLPAPDGELRAALGYIRREVASPGKKLQAGDTQLSVAIVPFAQVFPQRKS